MSSHRSSAFKDFLRSSLRWASRRPAQEEDGISLGRSEDELERPLLHHWCMTQGFGGMATAPVQDILNIPGARVLDIGCANGVWIMEMAAAFPQASFTGIDNDSYALPNSTMPSNVEFELADAVKQKLPFADESFDFIFLRAMSVSIGENEWPLLLKEIWRVLKPGGFFEKMDISETICPPQAVYSKKWEQAFKLALRERKGIDWYYINRLPEILPTLNLWTISSRTAQLPLGAHGDELGRLMSQNFWHMFENRLRFSGVTEEDQMQEYAGKMSEEFDNCKIYVSFTAIVARKSQV